MMKMRDGFPDRLKPIWDELLEGVQERIGSAGLEALCGQVYLLREAEVRIHEEGLVVEDSKGNPVPHPAIQIQKQAQSEIRGWMEKFGRYEE